jgi:ABC-2 type transport system ATP-binding protein
VPDAPMLVFDGVGKSWGDEVVLDGVDLVVPAGGVVGIAGGNGVGKTTLLRVATGIITPDTGSVLFSGRPTEEDLAGFRQAIGFLSAGDRGLYARLTVRHNLDFWGGLAGFSRRRRVELIEVALTKFEIEHLAESRADRLSMGQRQRVRLALTFLHEPRIVLLDEPRTSLDEAGIAAMERAVGDLVATGGCALVVSPETDEQAVDVGWVLRDGALHPAGGSASPAAASDRVVAQEVITR